MLKLFKLNDNKYVILYNNGVEFEGSKVDVIAQLLNDHISFDDVFDGLNALDNADMAEYGINRTFMYARRLVA